MIAFGKVRDNLPMNILKYCFIITLFVFLTACGNILADDIAPPEGSIVSPVATEVLLADSGDEMPFIQPSASNGLGIYLENCEPCHGQKGLGDGPKAGELPNPVTAVGSSSIARMSIPIDWFHVVSEGNLEKYMPPFKSLSERQRWDVLAYIYSFSLSQEDIELGKSIYQQECAGCHGDNGDGVDGPDSAISATRLNDLVLLINNSTSDFYSVINQGISPDMPSFAATLSENDQWAVANYLRSMTFSLSPSEVVQKADNVLSAPLDENGISGQDSEVSLENEDLIQDIGVVFGTITNGTSGIIPSEGQVTLYGFNQVQQVYSNTIKINQDGTYRFENISMPPDRVFRSVVEHDGIKYVSQVGTPHVDGLNLNLPVVVFDSTTDQSELFIDRLHLFVDQETDDLLRVVELYVISNRGDKTVTAQEPGDIVLSYPLPDNATSLEIQDGVLGERFLLTPEGFGDRVNITPGLSVYQLVYTYLLPIEGETSLTHPVPLSADAIVVLAPEAMKVESVNLQDDGVRDFQGQKFKMYSQDTLLAAEDIDLRISLENQFLSGIFQTNTNNSILIGGLFFGIVLISMGGYLFYNNRKAIKKNDIDIKDVNGESIDLNDSQTILDAIIALDDRYNDGDIPEEAYQQRRADLKDQLKTIIEDDTSN
jgi:mono/diheme cytochrome c family protein